MHEMQNSNIFSLLPGVHPIVYYRVDTGICHREPEEEKVDVTDVLVLGDAGHVVHEDEVHVVGRPTHHEDGDHHRAHVHYLHSTPQNLSEVLQQFNVPPSVCPSYSCRRKLVAPSPAAEWTSDPS